MLYGRKPIGTVAYLGGLMSLPEPFCWAWSQMIQYNDEYVCRSNESIHYIRSQISYHSAARNSLVDQMYGEWLLMLDTDITFEPDLLDRMLYMFDAVNHLEVLTGLYQHKGAPHSPVLYKWMEDGEKLEALGGWDVFPERYLVPVASAGAGCLLVRKSVYQRIKKELKESPFDVTHPFGEDHSFFLRLKKLGIQAYCDPSIQVHHLFLKALSLEDYHPDSSLIGPRQEVGKEIVLAKGESSNGLSH